MWRNKCGNQGYLNNSTFGGNYYLPFRMNHTLQRTTTENSKQIFLFWELRGHIPNFHIHVSVIYLYISTVDLPILLQECWNYVDQSWEYINRSQIHECANWDWGRALPRKGMHIWDFRCSVHVAIPVTGKDGGDCRTPWLPGILCRSRNYLVLILAPSSTNKHTYRMLSQTVSFSVFTLCLQVNII